jgi:hypothetical protein
MYECTDNEQGSNKKQ